MAFPFQLGSPLISSSALARTGDNYRKHAVLGGGLITAVFRRAIIEGKLSFAEALSHSFKP